MAYTAEISRNNPSCFLFIIDQSGSMSDKYLSVGKSKSEALADVINRMLQQLVIKCAKSEGVRDYYHVGVIGYGANGVSAAFSGNLAGQKLVPISVIANNPARIEERTKRISDGAGGLVDTTVKFPIWFNPTANGGTPMTEAFRQTNDIISNWLNDNPYCFPPVVIHITDGESTDGDPTEEINFSNIK
ncbi:MAG: VWA domain-containing protein [Candidatus Azobacteroides sp.]|nr:VWA domain-containing protein [Candidatus Azobacteroides sp.]